MGSPIYLSFQQNKVNIIKSFSIYFPLWIQTLLLSRLASSIWINCVWQNLDGQFDSIIVDVCALNHQEQSVNSVNHSDNRQLPSDKNYAISYTLFCPIEAFARNEELIQKIRQVLTKTGCWRGKNEDGITNHNDFRCSSDGCVCTDHKCTESIPYFSFSSSLLILISVVCCGQFGVAINHPGIK